ncbi:MAG: TonB-dependent receptor, partial [Oceanicaulis sp.]
DRGDSEFVAALTGTYTQPIGNNLEMFLRGEAAHTSEFALTTGLDPRPVANQEAFTLYSASVGLGAEDGAWQLQLWGRNITDEEYVKGGFPSVGYLGSSFNNYPGDPRTYGLTLRVGF